MIQTLDCHVLLWKQLPIQSNRLDKRKYALQQLYHYCKAFTILIFTDERSEVTVQPSGCTVTNLMVPDTLYVLTLNILVSSIRAIIFSITTFAYERVIIILTSGIEIGLIMISGYNWIWVKYYILIVYSIRPTYCFSIIARVWMIKNNIFPC